MSKTRPVASERGLGSDGEDASASADERRRAPGFDPYNQTRAARADKGNHRSPADMQRLSESIKGSPIWAPPQKTAVAVHPLKALHGELERVLAELARILSDPGLDPADHQVADLIATIRDVAHRLEDAIGS